MRVSRELAFYEVVAHVRARIEEIAAVKRRYGYRRIQVLLRREGWQINRKRTYRLYREAWLAVRRRKRKRIGPFERKPLPKPTAANRSWSMDFVSDGLADGRRLRCLAIEARTGLIRVSGRQDFGALPIATHHEMAKNHPTRGLKSCALL